MAGYLFLVRVSNHIDKSLKANYDGVQLAVQYFAIRVLAQGEHTLANSRSSP